MTIDFFHVSYGDGVSYQPLALLVVVVLPWLLLETWRSRRNERALRAAGAVEPPDDVYAWMRVVYPGMFVAMTLEGMVLSPGDATLVRMFPDGPTFAPADLAVVAGVGVFLVGKLLKWWAILSLGRLWTFHVLVLPGAQLVTNGPYRFLRHPNYVGLLGEIAGVALMMRAPITGVLSAIVFGGLLIARIRVEERALREAR